RRMTICGWTTRIPWHSMGNRSGAASRGVHRTASVLPSRLAAARLGADDCRDGDHDDLQRDAGDDAEAVRVADLRAAARPRRDGHRAVDRLPHAGRQVALDLRADTRPARLRDGFRRPARGRATLDSARTL